MTNNIDISDYQKLIFVNNINEDDLDIKSISNDYNFAVFFTNLNKDTLGGKLISQFDSINTIWYNGQRLTRFVGIDENNSRIDVDGNGHFVKLSFNEETGLLGIINDSILERIELESIEWNDLYNGNEYRIYSLDLDCDGGNEDNFNHYINSEIVVNAKDNKFKLYIYFYLKDNNININSIQNNIQLSSNYNFLINNNELISDELESSSRILYTYECSIKQDTYDTDISRKYTIQPSFDNTNIIKFNDLQLILNPTLLKIKSEMNGQYYNDNSFDIDMSNYDEGMGYFSIVLNPSEVRSHENRRPLYYTVSSSNSSVIDVEEGNHDIYDTFRIYPNLGGQATITVKLWAGEGVTLCKGKFIVNVAESGVERIGGTDNWWVDYQSNEIEWDWETVSEVDALLVENINLQEWAGDDDWCQCFLVDSGVKYKANGPNESRYDRVATFTHSTPDERTRADLDGIFASRANKPVYSEWHVTIIQHGKPGDEPEYEYRLAWESTNMKISYVGDDIDGNFPLLNFFRNDEVIDNPDVHIENLEIYLDGERKSYNNMINNKGTYDIYGKANIDGTSYRTEEPLRWKVKQQEGYTYRLEWESTSMKFSYVGDDIDGNFPLLNFFRNDEVIDNPDVHIENLEFYKDGEQFDYDYMINHKGTYDIYGNANINGTSYRTEEPLRWKVKQDEPQSGTYWYLSNELLTSNNTPHDIQAQNAEDHKGWRELDPNTDRLEIPYVEMDDRSYVNWCIAVPSSLGFNTIVNTANIDVTDGFNKLSNVTVNNVEYNVWTIKNAGWRISGFYLTK